MTGFSGAVTSTDNAEKPEGEAPKNVKNYISPPKIEKCPQSSNPGAKIEKCKIVKQILKCPYTVFSALNRFFPRKTGVVTILIKKRQQIDSFLMR